MELKKHFQFKYVFIFSYFVAFLVYIIIGLQPAGAVKYDNTVNLEMPSIGLSTEVAELTPIDRRLETPDEIAGSYSNADNKTLLIGHSTTVFKNLDDLKLNDVFTYNGNTYKVVARELLLKSHVNMKKLLKASEKETLVIITCAGELLDNNDATKRLIITAVAL